MTVVGQPGLPYDEGRRDALHHRDRIRKKITEHLKEHIGEEDIIAAGPEKKIKVPVKGTKRWQFILDRGQKNEGVGQGEGQPGDVLGPKGDSPAQGDEAGTEPGEEVYEIWLDMTDVEEMLFSELELPRLRPKAQADIDATHIVYDDIARVGPQLDKKATLRENLLRNAKCGRTRLGSIDKADLRYLSYREKPKPHTKAVVFLAMDVSGSMTTDRKRMARLFFYWCVQFLRSRYDQIELVFIAHTSTAREVNEEQFFGRGESGGTKVSSAFELITEIQQKRYPVDDWNLYVLHVSDGDNFTADNARTLELVRQLAKITALIGYLEVNSGTNRAYALLTLYEKEATDIEGFMFASAKTDKGLWPAIKKFFARESVEQAAA